MTCPICHKHRTWIRRHLRLTHYKNLSEQERKLNTEALVRAYS